MKKIHFNKNLINFVFQRAFLQLIFDSIVMRRFFLIAIALWVTLAESSVPTLSRTRRSSDTCGVAKGKISLIVQGQYFPRGTFPWIVALMYTETRPPSFFCAGTLISKTFVITGNLFSLI